MQKVALITGASSGLGIELARQLAAKGYDLALVARRQHLLDEIAKELRPSGQRVLLLCADVSIWTDIKAAIERTEQELGPISLLVANAGISSNAPLRRFDAIEARRVYEINVIGLMQTIAAALPFMLGRKAGHIVGISSLASYIPMPSAAVYCSSKAAASSYLEGLRTELLGTAITVTTICPGFVRTAMTAKNKFKMPWIMDTPKAVSLMLKAIEKRQNLLNFPWPLYTLIRVTMLFPRSLTRRVFRAILS
ncbi:MAG: SDR family NAD(P)-dependent oxidoreductase [Proteobacteria bacterium]|nr:SDR family NAD(P)-dependent oxidoreductase [Pseudomonadota bacterium]